MKSPTRSSRTLPPSRLSPPVLVLAALAAILTTATTVVAAESDPSCFYTTQEECREAALARGLSPGGGGFSFASDSWSYSKGCYFYSAGSGSSFAGRAFFGTGGTVEQMKTLGLPGRKERLYCETPGGADAPPPPSDPAEVAGGDFSPTAAGEELSQPDGNGEEDTISISNAVAVNEYCDNLDALEAHMDENYASLESGTLVTKDYECSCNEPDNMTLEIDCVMLYDNNGEIGTNFEGIVFKKKNVGTGYELAQTSWGDSFYQDGTVPQETYYFEEGQLTGCTATSCAFCKVCNDGASIALDCSTLSGDLGWYKGTCDDGITGSFANTFQFPALAANGSESSSAPSASSGQFPSGVFSGEVARPGSSSADVPVRIEFDEQGRVNAEWQFETENVRCGNNDPITPTVTLSEETRQPVVIQWTHRHDYGNCVQGGTLTLSLVEANEWKYVWENPGAKNSWEKESRGSLTFWCSNSCEEGHRCNSFAQDGIGSATVLGQCVKLDDCTYYTAEDCRAAAEKLGYIVKNNFVSSVNSYPSVGCYYRNDKTSVISLRNTAEFQTKATPEQMEGPIDSAYLTRLDCQTPPAETKSPVMAPTTAKPTLNPTDLYVDPVVENVNKEVDGGGDLEADKGDGRPAPPAGFGGTASETWCARTIDQSYKMSRTERVQLGSTDQDPLRCNESSDPIQTYYTLYSGSKRYRARLGICQEIQLIADIPVGFDDSDAAHCGRIPQSFDAFAEPEEGTEYTDFHCYYNILSNEFCGDAYGPAGYFQCYDLDEKKQTFKTVPGSGEIYQTALVKGSCGEPFVVTALQEPSPLTDSFVNARNQKLNEDSYCPLTNLQEASAQDTRQITLSVTYCSFTASGTLCGDATSLLMQGQELLLIGSNVIAQRQASEEICFSWQDENNRCRVKCIGVYDRDEVKLRTYFLSAGVNNYSGHDVKIRISSLSTEALMGADSSGEESSGSTFRTALTTLVSTILTSILLCHWLQG